MGGADRRWPPRHGWDDLREAHPPRRRCSPAGRRCAGVALVLTRPPRPRSAQQRRPPISTYVPPVKHVFVINIENKGYDDDLGPDSAAPYLAHTLRRKGVLLNDLLRHRAQLAAQLRRADLRPGAQPADAGATARSTRRFRRHRHRAAAAGGRAAAACSRPRYATACPTQLSTARVLRWKRLHGGHAHRRAGTRRSNTPGRHAEGEDGRPVRHPAQPVHVLPRRSSTAPAYCRAHVVDLLAAASTTCGPGRTTPQPHLHHARPLCRRPRRAVRRRPARRAGSRSTRG